MESLQAAMRKEGIEPFAFHDLKAKGISDHQDNFAQKPCNAQDT